MTKEPLELVNDRTGKNYEINQNGSERFVDLNGRIIRITRTRDTPSSKLEALDQLVKDIKARDPKAKIVIFSTFRDVVKKVCDRYEEHGTVHLMGGLTSNEADRRIQEFHDDDGVSIFAATLQSGGESISLTPANHVIFIDDPLTYQEKKQGIDRAYRFLQTREVYVYTLMAKDTYDEHVASIQAQGKLISDLTFDGDTSSGLKTLTDDLLEKLLQSFSLSKQAVEQILKFRATAIRPKPAAPAVKEVLAYQDDSGEITFKEGQLNAKLDLKAGTRREFRSFKTLLEAAPELTTSSKELLKKFFQGSLSSGIDSKSNIKTTIFWTFVSTLMPQIRFIDYHPEFEKNIEIGSMIVDLLIDNPDITVEQLNQHVDDQLALSKAIDFLERNNIFKALSLLGILPKQYYFNGQLLYYAHPISIFYRDEGVYYQDKEIIEVIAPKRRIAAASVADGFTGVAQQFRPLSREEEIRLAIEAYKHNQSAVEALLEHNMMTIVRITRGVYKNIKTRRTSLNFKNDDFEDVYQHVAEYLMKGINRYGRAANEQTFDEYFGKLIAKCASTFIHRRANIDVMETVRLDAPIDEDSDTSHGDMMTATIPQKEPSALEGTMAFTKMVEVLKNRGFQGQEIDIFRQFVESGRDDILETHGRSETEIEDIIDEARKTLIESGEFQRSAKNDESNAMNTNGGIDMTSDQFLQTQNSKEGFNFHLNPAMLQQYQNAPGFYPVIINFEPMTNLQEFMGLDGVTRENVA